MILSSLIAFFHLFISLSSETPRILNPFECNSLYNATTFGFSFLQGPHHEAQKSIKVTLPKDCFSDISLSSGLLAEKFGALSPIFIHCAVGAGAVIAGIGGAGGATGLSNLVLILLPILVFFNTASKLS